MASPRLTLAARMSQQPSERRCLSRGRPPRGRSINLGTEGWGDNKERQRKRSRAGCLRGGDARRQVKPPRLSCGAPCPGLLGAGPDDPSSPPPYAACPAGGNKHKLFRTGAAQLARRRRAAEGAAGKVLRFPASVHGRADRARLRGRPRRASKRPGSVCRGLCLAGVRGAGICVCLRGPCACGWQHARGAGGDGVELRVWKPVAANACETV